MGFTIKYATLLTLRCWYDPDLEGISGSLPLAPLPDAPSEDQLKEMRAYLRYDLRETVRLWPTKSGQALLDRSGARWLATTQGGVVVAKTTFRRFTEPLGIGCFLRDPEFFSKLAVYQQDQADALGADAGDGSALKSKVFYYANKAGNALNSGLVNGIEAEHFIDRPPGEDPGLIGQFDLYLDETPPQLDLWFNPKN